MQPPVERPWPRAPWPDLIAAVKCPTCDLTVLADWEFCEWCGTSLAADAAPGHPGSSPHRAGAEDAPAEHLIAQPATLNFLPATQQLPPPPIAVQPTVIAASLAVPAPAAPEPPMILPDADPPAADPSPVVASPLPALAMPNPAAADPAAGWAVRPLPVPADPVARPKPVDVGVLPAAGPTGPSVGDGPTMPPTLGTTPTTLPIAAMPVAGIPIVGTPVVELPIAAIAMAEPSIAVPLPAVPVVIAVEPLTPPAAVMGEPAQLAPPGQPAIPGVPGMNRIGPVALQAVRLAILFAYEANSPLRPIDPVIQSVRPHPAQADPDAGPGAVTGPQPATPIMQPVLPALSTQPGSPALLGPILPVGSLPLPGVAVPPALFITAPPGTTMPAPGSPVVPGVPGIAAVAPGPQAPTVVTGPQAPAVVPGPEAPPVPGRSLPTYPIGPQPPLWRGGTSGRVGSA